MTQHDEWMNWHREQMDRYREWHLKEMDKQMAWHDGQMREADRHAWVMALVGAVVGVTVWWAVRCWAFVW